MLCVQIFKNGSKENELVMEETDPTLLPFILERTTEGFAVRIFKTEKLCTSKGWYTDLPRNKK